MKTQTRSKSPAICLVLIAQFFMLVLCSIAQTTTAQLYTLLSGSQLTDDCPICDRIPIVVPLTGTFGLRRLDQNPISTSYELTNVSFTAGTTSSPQYQVWGTGIYQVGGEVAVSQQLFLNVAISNGVTAVNALCVSSNTPVTQPWPKIEIQVDQTNGTPAKVYHLALVAVPVPRIGSIVPDTKTGNVRLDWEATGATLQLERAKDVMGPYSAVTPISTNASFIDIGVLTNSPRFFYRLQAF
jgi:hypothetical protein